MAQLAGRWNLVETEGFDEYMKALGVGFALRKMGNLAKPTQEISIEGDKWNIKTLSTFKNTDISFTVGEEFEETTADGRKVKTTCTVEGDNKMIQDQKGEPDSTLTREVTENSMVMTCIAKGVTCTRKYQRAES